MRQIPSLTIEVVKRTVDHVAIHGGSALYITGDDGAADALCRYAYETHGGTRLGNTLVFPNGNIVFRSADSVKASAAPR